MHALDGGFTVYSAGSFLHHPVPMRTACKHTQVSVYWIAAFGLVWTWKCCEEGKWKQHSTVRYFFCESCVDFLRLRSCGESARAAISFFDSSFSSCCCRSGAMTTVCMCTALCVGYYCFYWSMQRTYNEKWINDNSKVGHVDAEK